MARLIDFQKNNFTDTMTDHPIPLSALNQYAYCPRRCYLIYAESEFKDNIHTQSGTEEHERVDQLQHEIKNGVRVEFALPVWSDEHDLTGRCDVVEFHPDGSVFPIEYKLGRRKQWLNDDLQVAAQALCLEEMLQLDIQTAAIYHIKSRRRREVSLSAILRQQLFDTIDAVKKLLAQAIPPPVTPDKKRCEQCSLNSLCEPELLQANASIKYLADHLFDTDY